MCKNFRDLILMDYMDKEIDGETKVRVDSHLRVCPECRQFAQEVENDLTVPFKKIGRETVPDHVWASIKSRIEKED